MPRRVLLVTGSGVGGAIRGGGLAAFMIVMGAAVFWLLIFGDNLWPQWAETALVVAARSVGLLVFLGALCLGWRKGEPR